MSLTKVPYSMIDGAPVSVKDYGAVGNGVADDTVAIQNAIDYVITNSGNQPKSLYFPPGNYLVSQISFSMPAGSVGTVSGIHVYFDGATISGKATGTYSSVVEVMAGYATFENMIVNANFNEGYECALHWYTNDLSKNYPGFVRFVNCTVTQALLGFCVGMLPSQGSTYYPSSATPAKPNAIDAPVSESFVEGMFTEFCVTGVRFEQPNGKVPFTNCTLSGVDTYLPGHNAATQAVMLYRGEMSVIGGFLECISQPDGKIATVVDGTFNLIGVIMESVSPLAIYGAAEVRICNDCNWGVNGASDFFWVNDTATGQLTVTDSFLLRGQGSGYPKAVVRTISNPTGSLGINTNFWCNFTNVKFGNCVFETQTGNYLPLVRNTRATYTNCWLATYNGSSVLTNSYRMNPQTNLLSGKVDLSTSTVTAYGLNGSATSGGWTFATASPGSVRWGKVTSGLPTIVDTPVTSALRLTAGAGGSGAVLTATSPKFNVVPGKFYLITGYILAGTSGSTIQFNGKFYNFTGSASSITATWNTFTGPESQFTDNSSYIPFELWMQAPSDSTQCEFQVYTENGADITLFNLSVA